MEENNIYLDVITKFIEINKKKGKSIFDIEHLSQVISLTDVETLKDESEEFINTFTIIKENWKTLLEVLKDSIETLFPILEPKKEFPLLGEINWTEDENLNTWNKITSRLKGYWGNGKEYNGEELDNNWKFLISHSNNEIKGKAQLIESVQKKINLVKLVVIKIKDKETKEDKYIKKFFFFDEKYDKRYDGPQISSFSMDFWLYRVITEEGKEFYILSQEKLPAETCIFRGMTIEIEDFAEFSRSMKVKSLSRIFMLKDYTPSVCVLPVEELVKYTKERGITEEDWINFLGYHSWETINKFPKEVELLRSAFILSGEKEDYPLHLAIVGPPGTKKSCGHIETIAYKFDESSKIMEGGNSRIKGLSPSFKEKPASIGYLAECERIGFIDELGKMIDFEREKHQVTQGNILGELNFLLDHKKRSVSSGNDNACEIQATAKFLFVTNPCSGKYTLQSHVGILDPTFMSRILWWVQDGGEQKFLFSPEAIQKFVQPDIEQPPQHLHKNIHQNFIKGKREKGINYKKMLGGLLWCKGKVSSREEFLTLFDTCISYNVNVDANEVRRLVNLTIQLAREPMKSSVWKPRAEHHIHLLIDGLVKHRCLFKDYDPTLTPKEEDYSLAELILVRMVKSWDVDLSLNSSRTELF